MEVGELRRRYRDGRKQGCLVCGDKPTMVYFELRIRPTKAGKAAGLDADQFGVSLCQKHGDRIFKDIVEFIVNP